MTRMTRRAVLAGIGATLPLAAAAFDPLDADTTGPLVADDDAELLALVAEFHRLYAHHQDVEQRLRAKRAAAAAIAPPLSDPSDFTKAAMDQDRLHHDFVRSRVGKQLWDQWNQTAHSAGLTLRAVFKIPAHTPAGILAKVELYRLAYGSCPQGCEDHGEVKGDEGLDAYDVCRWTDYEVDDEDGEDREDPDWRPWLDTIVADLRALAGEARS